jgi:hypothetical protein
MTVIAELEDLRRQAKVAAQAAYVAALIAGDAEDAMALLPASQHGTLERNLLERFDLFAQFEEIQMAAAEAADAAQEESSDDLQP